MKTPLNFQIAHAKALSSQRKNKTIFFGIRQNRLKVVYTLLKKNNLTQRRKGAKVLPAISGLNQFNYWHLQHLVRPRIIKVFFHFLSLRLSAFA